MGWRATRCLAISASHNARTDLYSLAIASLIARNSFIASVSIATSCKFQRCAYFKGKGPLLANDGVARGWCERARRDVRDVFNAFGRMILLALCIVLSSNGVERHALSAV